MIAFARLQKQCHGIPQTLRLCPQNNKAARVRQPELQSQPVGTVVEPPTAAGGGGGTQQLAKQLAAGLMLGRDASSAADQREAEAQAPPQVGATRQEANDEAAELLSATLCRRATALGRERLSVPKTGSAAEGGAAKTGGAAVSRVPGVERDSQPGKAAPQKAQPGAQCSPAPAPLVEAAVAPLLDAMAATADDEVVSISSDGSSSSISSDTCSGTSSEDTGQVGPAVWVPNVRATSCRTHWLRNSSKVRT